MKTASPDSYLLVGACAPRLRRNFLRSSFARPALMRSISFIHDITLHVRLRETHMLFDQDDSGRTSLLMAIMGLSRYRDGGAILSSLLRLMSVIMDYDHAAAWPCRWD